MANSSRTSFAYKLGHVFGYLAAICVSLCALSILVAFTIKIILWIL